MNKFMITILWFATTDDLAAAHNECSRICAAVGGCVTDETHIWP